MGEKLRSGFSIRLTIVVRLAEPGYDEGNVVALFGRAGPLFDGFEQISQYHGCRCLALPQSNVQDALVFELLPVRIFGFREPVAERDEQTAGRDVDDLRLVATVIEKPQHRASRTQ